MVKAFIIFALLVFLIPNFSFASNFTETYTYPTGTYTSPSQITPNTATSTPDTTQTLTTNGDQSSTTTPTAPNASSENLTRTTNNSSTTTQPVNNFYQPKPKVTNPIGGAKLSDGVNINVYIQPTVVQRMEIYANDIHLGLAIAKDSSNWQLVWDSNKLANGTYNIWAKATVLLSAGPIDTFSEKIGVIIENIEEEIPVVEENPQTANTNEENTVLETENKSTPLNTAESTTVQQPESETKTETKTPLINKQIAKQENWTTLKEKKFESTALEKISLKKDASNKKYLVFEGAVEPSSLVKLIISSKIITLTTRADSNGRWSYIFEKPLESGNHTAKVEVLKSDGTSITSGPFNFSIARVRATTENPNGESLELVDPSKQLFRNYYLAAGIIVLLGLILIFVLKIMRKRKYVKALEVR